MKRNKWMFGLVAIAAGLALSASSGPGAAAGPGDRAAIGTEVKIDNFSFAPANLTVPAGTTVTWTNRDDVPHVVTSDDKIFKSKPLDTDDRFSFTFSKPGTYEYFCAIHPKMMAKIVVQ